MNNIALLILRVVFAGSLLYGHGLGKLSRLVEGNLSFSNPNWCGHFKRDCQIQKKEQNGYWWTEYII